MLKIPAPNSSVGQDLHSLAFTSQGKTLLSWLSTSRGNILEMMTQVTDETKFRQFQGAAIVLADLIASLERKPERGTNG